MVVPGAPGSNGDAGEPKHADRARAAHAPRRPAVSRIASANSRFSRLLSSARVCRRFACNTSSPRYRAFQLKKLAPRMPCLRRTSAVFAQGPNDLLFRNVCARSPVRPVDRFDVVDAPPIGRLGLTTKRAT